MQGAISQQVEGPDDSHHQEHQRLEHIGRHFKGQQLLGEGRRLLPAGFPYTKLTLTSAKPSTTGVILATYEVARP